MINREFERLNADLLTARERNDVEQITKYQKMMLELQKEISVLQSPINPNEQEWKRKKINVEIRHLKGSY
jgi:hypothetical protein